MKSLRLNGEVRDNITASTVEQLICELNLPPSTLLVERNGTALHRKEWTDTMIQSGDVIELLRITAGG
ncbi:MAG: thiamine biosynthesis protein ThiS [Verrucomicrobia bacterium]|nr:MAG: thiamine biosynthesis protein ThiS [Verrucomicrobiota bacterium]